MSEHSRVVFLEKRYVELSESLAEARRLLEPFARIARVAPSYRDDAPAWGFDHANLTYGDFQRARDFLERTS